MTLALHCWMRDAHHYSEMTYTVLSRTLNSYYTIPYHTACVRSSPYSKVWYDPWPVWYGSWVTHVMGYHPAKFELTTPFCSRLRVRHRTDRRTDRRRPSMLMPHPMGRVHNKLLLVEIFVIGDISGILQTRLQEAYTMLSVATSGFAKIHEMRPYRLKQHNRKNNIQKNTVQSQSVNILD